MTDTRTTARPTAKKPLRQIDDALRERIATAVELLISALDATEATDEDLEPAGDERDGNVGPFGLSEDDEPSLGALDNRPNQANWLGGNDRDLEEEHDGSEPDVDDEEGHDAEADGDDLENSLGWTEAGALWPATTFFVNDGEEGGLSAHELEARRAEYRARREAEREAARPADGSDVVFVEIQNGKVIGPASEAALRKAGILV